MSDRSLRLFIVGLAAFLFFAGGGLPSLAAPGVTISAPSAGSEILSNPVNVTGTASPTNATWLQKSKADFDAGTKDNITLDSIAGIKLTEPGGPVPYDDFDDNSINPSLWTRSDNNGLTVSEVNSELRISGTAQAGYWLPAGVWTTRRVYENFSADLRSVSASGLGYITCIYLYQDPANKVSLGIRNDGVSGQQGGWATLTEAGKSYDFGLGALAPGSHHFELSKSAQGLYLGYIDGKLLFHQATYANTFFGGIAASAYYTGDTVDARWGNATIDPTTRVFDDFNDDAVDLARWGIASVSGLAATEQNGELRQSGTGTGDGTWTSYAAATSKISFPCLMSAELESLSATGSGYYARLMLYQDDKNYLWVGVDLDPIKYGSQPVLWWGYGVGGFFVEESIVVIAPVPHTFTLDYSRGMAFVIVDGSHRLQKAFNCQNPVCRIETRARLAGDTVDARWDNVRTGCDRTVYDDFNDNLLDADRWTRQESSGFTASEENGCLRISGGFNAGGAWGTTCSVISNSSTGIIFGDLKSISQSASGYAYGVGLMQDASNSVYYEIAWDPLWGGPIGYSYVVQNGVTTQDRWGSSGYPLHNLGLVYRNGCAKVFIDGLHYYDLEVNLNRPVGLVGASLRAQGDSATFEWEEVTIGWDFRPDIPSGVFTSGISDTRCPAPVPRWVSWKAGVPKFTGLGVQLHSSDSADMSAPTAWATLSNNQSSGFPTLKRYIEYRVMMARSVRFRTPSFQEMSLFYQRPVARVELSVDGQSTWSLAAGRDRWYLELGLPENNTTVWARVTDAAGDFSVTSISVEVDTTAPVGSILINNGDPFSTSREVSVGMDAFDHYGIASMILSSSPDFTDTDWVEYAPILPFSLTGGDGPKTVYTRFKDVHGWESGVANDSIYLHTAPPTGTVVINGGSEFTDAASVTLGLNASDIAGIAEMRVSNGADFALAAWQPYRTELAWDLPAGSGERTVFAAFRNSLQQVSAAATDTILLDTTAPELRLTINDGAQFTRSAAVTLGVNASDDYRVGEMLIGNLPELTRTEWRPFASPVNWDLPQLDGTLTVYAMVRDAAGNEGPVASASIILDTAAPATSIPPLPSITDDWNVTVNWTGSDPTSGVLWFDVQVREGEGPWTDWILKTGKTSGKYAGLDGHRYSFRARAQDRAGNLGSYPDSGTGPVLINIPGPLVSILKPAEGAGIDGLYTVKGIASHPNGGLTVAAVEVRLDEGAWHKADGTLNWSFRLDTTKLSDGRHTIRVRAFDGAKYSPEARAGVIVSNGNGMLPMDIFMPVLAIVILVVVIGALTGRHIFRNRRRAGAGAPVGEGMPRGSRPSVAGPAPGPPNPVEDAGVKEAVDGPGPDPLGDKQDR